MIEQLFGSKTRVKLLQLFFSNPNRSFYVREITRKIDEQINSVRRELANLLSIGIIGSDTNNNRLYYEVNQDYEYYRPLQAIFGSDQPKQTAVVADDSSSTDKADKTDGTDELKKLGNVDLVVFTGKFTRDESSGVDVLLVGDLNATKVEKFIAQLEEKEAKSLNYSVFTLKEFEYRRQVNDRFIGSILDSKKQVLIDKKKIAK